MTTTTANADSKAPFGAGPPDAAIGAFREGDGSHLPLGEIQLVAIDIDGTLLRTDKRVSRRVLEAIADAREAGVKIVLATARPPRGIRSLHEKLELDTLQINYNGALIHDRRRGRTTFHLPLDPLVVKRICRTARRVDREVVISVEILDKWYTDFFDDSATTETSRSFSPDFVGPLEAFLTRPVTKLMLLAPPQRLDRIRKVVEKRHAGQIATTVSDEHLLQIMHPKVSKSAALARVSKDYGIAPRNVMAVGDAPNDAGMLRWSGLGVAVHNAWPVVREAADVVAPSNDDDGVAYAINRFVLERV